MQISSGANLKDINQGPGTVFLGSANTAWALATLQQVGTHSPEGVKVDFADSFFNHMDANGRNLCSEIIGQEGTIKLEILQFNPAVWDKLMGHGSFSTTVAGTEAFTNLEITLFNEDWTELPGRNVTISSANDGGATPVSYTITDDYEFDGAAGSNRGFIRRVSGSDITSGDTIYATGTFTRNETQAWDWDPDTSTDYFGMRIKQRRRGGELLIFDFWKVQRISKLEVLEMKNGSPFKVAVTFNVLQDLSKDSLGRITYETPS